MTPSTRAPTSRQYAAARPGQVTYLQHPGHANLGMSASRNLGLKRARGEFLAFLDADDVWLPQKLDRQVPRLQSQPHVEMLYGATEYWHSWTMKPEDRQRDHLWNPGVSEPTTFDPPTLLELFLCDKMLMPCMGSILIRREAVEGVAGWEDSFHGLFEDQVFFAKLCVKSRIQVTNECFDRYRQHPASACAVGTETGQLPMARETFLNWLAEYLSRHGMMGLKAWEVLQQLPR